MAEAPRRQPRGRPGRHLHAQILRRRPRLLTAGYAGALLAVVGPGVLAGLSDDDPAGITWPQPRHLTGRWSCPHRPRVIAGLPDSVPGGRAAALEGWNPGVAVVRIDAGEAWCVRARATAWRGDLWDR